MRNRLLAENWRQKIKLIINVEWRYEFGEQIQLSLLYSRAKNLAELKKVTDIRKKVF